ncbi:cytochrome P450 [Dactylosporangium matsuzakiense]|uniref:Cytochrome P450 hydroxylase n=1 Tax=Dactylosporangium matsuzakiense TaxID=53360 RepID=A0A9W6KWZ9_9ACTN|nr:cytochrome P450 [Dactylosporangium matsuzakiense]GLL08745.1 cytochrome P450 hydroxylase [Dactylosporangium matsuzakiense]
MIPGAPPIRYRGYVTTPLQFTQAFWNNPHPVYAQLREESPVRPVTLPNGMEIWLVTRYADCRAALADPRLSKRQGAGDNARSLAQPVRSPLTRHLLANDPPDHTRLRRLVSREFTARRVEALRPRVGELSAALIASLRERGASADLVEDYAVHLPIQVICELLGVPIEDQADFRRWTSVMVSASASAGGAGVPEAAAAFVGYLLGLIGRKRAAPAGDLLSALIATRDEGDRLDEDELTSMAFLLLLAGHETTVNLIGSGMYTLLTRPDVRRSLEADPALVPAAVEEFLRLESPVETATSRTATEPVTYGGVTIPAGAMVAISLLAADRDPERFPEPDAFDLGRPDNQHLAFGYGIHYCLGAPLARLEAQIAFTDLLAAFPGMALAVPADRVDWRPGTLIRGPVALPVTL